MESINKNSLLTKNDLMLPSVEEENSLNYFLNLNNQYINYLMNKIDIMLFELIKEDLKNIRSKYQ